MYEHLLPVAYSLGAGFLFALGTHFISLGMRHSDPQTGALIDIGASTLCFWLLLPFLIEWHYWLTAATAIFIAVGFFRPFMSASLGAWGVRYLGPTLTSTVSATTPFFGAGFGVLLLGEHLTLPIAAGTAAIIFGMVLLSYRGKVKVAWPVWALLFPLGAAIVRAGANSFNKVGLEFVPSPYYAGLVTFTVSFIIALGVQGARGVAMPNFRTSPGLLWFVAAGIIHALAVTFVNFALQISDVIIVLPLISTYPLFALLLSLLVFKREILSARTIVAVSLVIPGVLLIAISR
ncbi:MAG: EamA family transporter [Alphaproteobacteria bacterium]|nr:EamA family transporter [Alphaproteobacteria bacterium]